MLSRHIWFDKVNCFTQTTTWLLVSEMRLIIMMIHSTSLNIKILHIDITEPLTQTNKNITFAIIFMMLFTRLWFEKPFKLPRWIKEILIKVRETHTASQKGKRMISNPSVARGWVPASGVWVRLPPGMPHLCLLEAQRELSQTPVQQQHSCNSCKYGWVLQRLPSFMGIKGENKKQCCNVLPGRWNCCLQKPKPEYLSSQPLIVSENIQYYTDFTVELMTME